MTVWRFLLRMISAGGCYDPYEVEGLLELGTQELEMVKMVKMVKMMVNDERSRYRY